MNIFDHLADHTLIPNDSDIILMTFPKIRTQKHFISAHFFENKDFDTYINYNRKKKLEFESENFHNEIFKRNSFSQLR